MPLTPGSLSHAALAALVLALPGSCQQAPERSPVASKPPDQFQTEIRLRVSDPPDGKKPAHADGRALTSVLEKRLTILAPTGGSVDAGEGAQIVIRAPLVKADEMQLRALVRPGRLELRSLQDIRTNLNPKGQYLLDVTSIQDSSPVARPPTVRFLSRRTNRPIAADNFLRRCPLLLSNEDLEPGAARRLGSGAFVSVLVRFTKRSSERFAKFRSKPGRLIAVVLDGEMVGIHAVSQALPRRKKGDTGDDDPPAQLEISGAFTAPEEADYLAVVLNSGALPAPLAVVAQKQSAERRK